MKSASRIFMALILAAALIMSASAQDKQGQKKKPALSITPIDTPADKEQKQEPQVSGSEAVVKIGDKQITRDELKDILAKYMPPRVRFMTAGEIAMNAHLYEYADTIKEVLAVKFLAPDIEKIQKDVVEKSDKEAKVNLKEGSEQDSLAKRIEQVKQNTKYDYYLQNFVFEKEGEVSEDEAKKYYEQNKEQYLKPFSFKIRQIFVSTYAPYTVKDGDTLEKIAEEISKNKEQIKFIITDDEQKKPRWVDPKDREKEPFKEIEPGEKLLVPMSEAEKGKVKEKMLSIKKELDSGADFVKLAEKYSTAQNPGEELGPIVPKTKPILQEIQDAVKNLKTGECSGIVQTKHGFTIIKVTEKNDEAYIPFEEIKANLQNYIANEKRTKAFFSKLTAAIKSNPKIQYNEQAIVSKDPKPDEAILEVGNVRYTSEKLIADAGAEDIEKATTPEKKIELLLKPMDTRIAVLDALCAEAKFEGNKDFQEKLGTNLAKFVIPIYIDTLAKEKVSKDDAGLKKYFEDNKENFKKPREMELRQIALKISDDMGKLKTEEKTARVEELKKKLNNIRQQVKDEASFETLASKYTDEKEMKDKGGKVGRVPASYRGGFKGVLDKIKEGEVSEPIEIGNSVYLLYATNIKEEHIPSYDEVKTAVDQAYTSDNIKKNRAEIINDILKKNNLTLLAAFDKKDEPKK